MKAIGRRHCIKQMMSGLAFMAAGNISLPLAAQQKKPASPTGENFWKRVDQAKARDLVQNAIKAARAEVETQRAINASKRAEVLLGADAAKEHKTRAASHYEERNASLRATKDSLARFVKTAAPSGEKQFTAFTGKGGLKEFAQQARKTTIATLMNSDVSPQEAQAAVKALDERLNKVQSLNSFQELTSHLDQHLDELIARKMPEEDPNGLCVLILLLASIYLALLVVAVIICIFTLGFDCQNIFNDLLAQICP